MKTAKKPEPITFTRPEYVSTRGAARACGVSIFTIQRWFDSGYLQGAKTPGGRRRIFPESLQEFMKKQGMTNLGGGAVALHSVLLVDDDIKLLSTMKDILSVGEKYSVSVASTGVEAGILMMKLHPDTLVIDIMLEDISGVELVRRVRENLGNRMRIIAISGRSSPADIKSMLAAGANIYLTKPFNGSDLVNAIEGRPVAKK